jgi:acetylornithine deacetylase/succinyl-diaminopimelate desuccinylase-like protein
VVGDDPTGEVTELLQQLIRNACVNDGSAGSGHEIRSAEVLQGHLEGAGLDVQRYEPTPGRASVVARIEGSDPSAPTLLLMGHTDVVPATEGWRHDPFGGELIDGEVWGRGAIDMLNLTSSMAVAVRRLARSGFRPKGTLVYLAVADEEANGEHGAQWLTERATDAVGADYVVTESGGIQMPTAAGVRLPAVVGEKGSYWCRLTIHGTPGHASTPLRSDNALVKAAEVVRRLAEHRPETSVHDLWRRFVEGMAFPAEMAEAMVDPGRLPELLDTLPDGLAKQAHACTHTTFAPTVMRAGTKTNIIPDVVHLEVDIRTLPGQSGADVRAELETILGDLGPSVEVAATSDDPSTASAIDTPLWDSMARVTGALVPGSALVPLLSVGATDARFFRRLGVPSYGFGLFSPQLGFDQYTQMFHGDDERIDQGSLRLSTELWEALAVDFLG